MESDGVYRFVALRSVQLTPSDLPVDPFVNAYGAADATTPLLQGASVALAANDQAEAQSLCATFVRDLQLKTNDPWELIPPLRAIAATLAALARHGSPEAADKLLASGSGGDAGSHAVANVPPPQQNPRSRLADLLLCQALLPDSEIPAESTAQMILCIDTLERLRAPNVDGQPAARRLAWRIPLTRGRVYLPLQLDRLTPTRVAARRGASPMMAAALTPPRTWMGDLILLRQKVRGYFPGEIAHVENVLLNETFKRTFRSTNKTEQTLATQTDVTRESERDLQTTTRDELRTEIQKAQSEELSLGANFNVQASFSGGSYSLVAGAGGSVSYRRASEERENTSMAHAREIVDKAVERISERVHTIQETMTSHEVEDVAEHSIINVPGKDHIVGVYRWLEKRVDLHLINYGRRTIYELMVPEPATFWSRLVTQRGNGSAGPPPIFPALPPAAGGQPTDLTPENFALRSGAGALAVPVRWSDLQRLAGNWGVQLEDPPPVYAQANLSFSVDGKEGNDPEKDIHSFELPDGSLAFYASPVVASDGPKEKLKVPEGYLATSGDLSLKGWMYVKRLGDHYQFERGSCVLLVGGQKFAFTEGVTPGGTETGQTGASWKLDAALLLQNPLAGDLTIVLTTDLNGVAGTIWLSCVRTPELEDAWAHKMFALFAAAYEARLEAYDDAKTRAALASATWAGNLPSATCREIEKRELKRGVLTQFTLGGLAQIGDAVLSEPAASSPVPAEPQLKLDAIDDYARQVSFFEEVFDWSNMSYIFGPYMYARRGEWANRGVADDADAQFKAFLGAGAARVQVPVRPGYEPHAEYFFRGLGAHPTSQRIPWLGSMRSIAEDLAAEAREGFTIGLGTLSVTKDSAIVRVTGGSFKDPDDLNRELRIAGGLYIIASVATPDTIELTHPFAGTTAATLPYETGGIVVGPPIELTLPTTLVAIDKEDLTLPTFPGRYV